MKKSFLSKRSLKFIRRNSLNEESVRDYVESLCSAYNIADYEFKECLENGTALFVKNYIVYLDEEFVELKLLKDEKVIRKFQNDSCWIEVIKYLEKSD